VRDLIERAQSFGSGYMAAFAARCLALVGPFGVAIVTARMLGPEDRGRYYYVMTLVAVGVQLASLGVHSSNGYLVAKRPELLPRILTNTAWIALFGGATAACGVIIFDVMSGQAVQRHLLVAVVLALCPLNLLFLFLSNLLVAIERTHVFNALLIFGSLVSLSATVVAALVDPALGAFLFAAVAASAVTSVVTWLIIAGRVELSWAFDRPLFSEGIEFALRVHSATLMGFLMARISVLLLRHDEAFGEIGHWSVAAQISDALLLLPATTALLLFPALVRATDADRWRQFTSMLLRVGGGMAVICIIAAVTARPAITVLFGQRYDPAVDILIALLPSVFFLSATTMASQFLAAIGMPWMQVAAWITALVVQIGLSLLALKHGAVALAWVQSACAGIVCLWLLAMARRYSPNKVQC
jgi:O-antigen/teichoic acid export membrane protein